MEPNSNSDSEMDTEASFNDSDPVFKNCDSESSSSDEFVENSISSDDELDQCTDVQMSSALLSPGDDPKMQNRKRMSSGSELQLYDASLQGKSSAFSVIGGSVSEQQTRTFHRDLGCSDSSTTTDKACNKIGHDNVPVNQIFINVGGKTSTKPARKKRKTTTGQTPVQTLRRTTECHIEELTTGMIHTAATQLVLDMILQGKIWVTVTGGPGEGKTTAAHLALKKLHAMGRQVYEIRTPADYFKVKDYHGAVLLFNDIFGSYQFCQNYVENWQDVLKSILQMKEQREIQTLRSGKINPKRTVCVILVSRSSVFSSAISHLGRFKDLVLESVVNLTCDIKTSPQERFDIWKCHADIYDVHIDEETVTDVCSMPLSHGFPHCCRLFADKQSKNKNVNMKIFFSKPIDFLNQTVESFLEDPTTGPLLREMLKRDGYMKLDDVTNDDRRYQYKTAAKRLKGTYVSEENDSLRFHHAAVYDSVAFVVCENDPLFVIRHCSLSFLNERVRFESLVTEGENVPLVINISAKYLDVYIKRLKAELENVNISPVLSHPSLHDQRFVEKFMETILSGSPNMSKASFIKDFILKKDKQSEQTVLFHSTNSKSDKLLKYICNHVHLSQKEKVDMLFGICEHSAVSSLKFLLSKYDDIDLNETDARSFTPLLIASTKSSAEMLKLLTEKGADVTIRDRGGNSVLHHVCLNGVDDDGDVVKMLMEKDTESYWKSENHLLLAAKKGHNNIVKVLIDKGATVNETDCDGRSALHYACFRGYTGILSVLFDKVTLIDIADKKGLTPLHCACIGGHVNAMTVLLDKGADINQMDRNMCTALHHTCRGGHVNAMLTLLQRKLDIHKTDINKCTALHHACRGGNAHIMTALLDRGNDINQTDINSCTALHHACRGGNVNAITALLDRGLDIHQKDINGCTALHHAARGGNVNAMVILLNRDADIKQTDNYGCTALHHASRGGNFNAIKVLLDKDVDINQADINGCTALHHACRGGNVQAIKYLLDRAVDINQKDINGLTALHHASRGRNVNAITFLLDRDLDIKQTDTNGCSALHHASKGRTVNNLTFLLDKGLDINQVDVNGYTALHHACEEGHVSIVRALLERDLAINHADKDGLTPLHLACQAGKASVLGLLLKRKADPFVTDSKENNPVHIACKNNHLHIVKAILSNMDDTSVVDYINMVNQDSKSPLQLVCENIRENEQSSEEDNNELYIYLIEKGSRMEAVSTIM